MIDKEVYETLMDRRGLIDKKYEEVEYLFFSLSGYSKWVKENVDSNKVKLLEIADIYAITK